MSPVETLLCDLIALPSVNPAFLPVNHPHGGEKQVADFLVATAEKAGLDVDRQDVLKDRDNVIVRLEPEGEVQRTILLAPHMDTVGVTSESQLKPVLKDGKIYGRGACDTKGSIAAYFQAVMEIANDAQRPKHTEIILAALVDEENCQGGSRVLAASGAFEATLAIVGEPTRLRVVTSHKGDLWLRIQTKGKAAHGSKPSLGRNAVLEMAKVVQMIEGDYAEMLKKARHPLLGSPTVCVGTIFGGRQPNIVPDNCEITIDRRTIPGETTDEILREINRLLNESKLRAGLLDIKGLESPPLETDPENELIRALMKAARQAKPAGADYFCDAAIIATAGVPSVVFGPGDIAQAHTADEWVGGRQLNDATRILTRFLQQQP